MAEPTTSDAAGIVGLYRRHGLAWARDRGDRLHEGSWIERFAALMPAGAAVLDLGCGSGRPLARTLIERGCRVTGIDTAPALIALCQASFPGQAWQVADMRTLSLGRRFDGLLAWDSYFHLDPDDQRRMFRVFEAHARPGAALMLTTGPRHGVALGAYAGETLFHASLDPAEYRAQLARHGFREVAHVAEDPDCLGRTVWLARAEAA